MATQTVRFRPGKVYTGRVLSFRNSRGFGFIERRDGPDVFVHFSDIQSEGYKTLQEGDRVEFQIEQYERGVKAVKVRVL